jgi:hypothetical protein
MPQVLGAGTHLARKRSGRSFSEMRLTVYFLITKGHERNVKWAKKAQFTVHIKQELQELSR